MVSDGRVLLVLVISRAAQGIAWIDDMLDPVPVVSQAKTLFHMLHGDVNKAVETQDRFSKRCPGISQLRSLMEFTEGDARAAQQTQHEFLNQPSEFVKNFMARDSLNEAELLGNELKAQALEDLEALLNDVLLRLPVHSKLVFVQLAQCAAVIFALWRLFSVFTVKDLILFLAKCCAAALLIGVLDASMSLSLELHVGGSLASRGDAAGAGHSP